MDDFRKKEMYFVFKLRGLLCYLVIHVSLSVTLLKKNVSHGTYPQTLEHHLELAGAW